MAERDSKIKVVHVLDMFPSKSETFIINFIVESINQNFSAQILANNLLDLEVSSQSDLIKKYNLYQTAESYNPKIPKNKIKRILKAILVLLKYFKHITVFFKTLNTSKYGLKSKTLKMWFQASVFLKHRDAKIFHAHFGLNAKLLSEMKEIGAINGRIISSFYGYDTFSTDVTRNDLIESYKGIFEKSQTIITSSDYLSNNLSMLNVPKEKVLINPVGVDVKLFDYKYRTFKDVFKIITVGRLMTLKGQHLGVEVVDVLKKRGHNVFYTIVGYGEEYENLKQKIQHLNLEKEIEILGSRTQEEIIKLLYENHLFLMTSITDETGRAEGQGLVIVEAQATGIPVVGFDSGGVPETIDNTTTGFVVSEGNVSEMADAVEQFIQNPELISTMGKAARSFVEQNFNNEIQSKNIVNLYND